MHENLIKYLEEHEIGHNAFARKIKTPASTLNRILKNKQTPSLKIAIMIDKYTRGEISVYGWLPGVEPKNNTHKQAGKKDEKNNKSKKNKSKL